MIAHDGRQFRDTSRPGEPSRPLRDTGHPIITTMLAFGAAERYEVLLVPTVPGRYLAHVDWTHWVTGKQLGTRSVPIDVTA